MQRNIDSELVDNLKDKLDALIKKGVELSEGMDVSERNEIIKRVIDETFESVLFNLRATGKNANNSDELSVREREIRRFIYDYYDQKIKELGDVWPSKK